MKGKYMDSLVEIDNENICKTDALRYMALWLPLKQMSLAFWSENSNSCRTMCHPVPCSFVHSCHFVGIYKGPFQRRGFRKRFDRGIKIALNRSLIMELLLKCKTGRGWSCQGHGCCKDAAGPWTWLPKVIVKNSLNLTEALVNRESLEPLDTLGAEVDLFHGKPTENPLFLALSSLGSMC